MVALELVLLMLLVAPGETGLASEAGERGSVMAMSNR